MSDRPLKIFISYRQADSRGYSGSLAHSLEQEFGTGNVFRDVTSLEAGVVYGNAIEHAVKHADVVLCLIGEHWTTIADADGHPRIHKEDDPVHQEVRTALGGRGTVIPVLLENAPLPARDELPTGLRPILDTQAVRLRDAEWGHDLNRLLETLRNVRSHKSWPTLSGQQVVDRFRGLGKVSPSWVGRAGGLHGRTMKEDVETGRWRGQIYQVQFGGSSPGTNWFSVQDFVDSVDEGQPEPS